MEDLQIRQEDRRSIEDRLLRAEWTLNLHSDAIDRLDETSKRIANDLGAIQKTLSHIKYFAFGVLAIYAGDELGLLRLLKALIGVLP